jgi:hypothetical protein
MNKLIRAGHREERASRPVLAERADETAGQIPFSWHSRSRLLSQGTMPEHGISSGTDFGLAAL